VRRRRIRHRGGQFASYLVTHCALDRKCLFGEIVADEMRLRHIGTVVASCWDEIPKRFSGRHLRGVLLLAGL